MWEWIGPVLMWFGTKPIRPTQVGMYRSPSLRGKCTDELFHACGNDSQFCPCWSNGLKLIPHLRGNDFKIAAIVIILCYYFPYMWECFESQGNHRYFLSNAGWNESFNLDGLLLMMTFCPTKVGVSRTQSHHRHLSERLFHIRGNDSPFAAI